MYAASILWRRLDQPGYDFCLLENGGEGWRLSGTAIFSERGVPCRLDYEIICDEEWRAIRGMVSGKLGDRSISVDIAADPSSGWRLNGILVPTTMGCLDLDLSFTPSTNLISVRRLDLEIGSSSASPSAWFAFPEMELEPLEQTYHRKDRGNYHYSANAGYSVNLRVNEVGFVTLYPGRWESVADAQ